MTTQRYKYTNEGMVPNANGEWYKEEDVAKYFPTVPRRPFAFFAMVLIIGFLSIMALFVFSGCSQKKERYINPLIWNLLEQKPREKQTEKEPEQTNNE